MSALTHPVKIKMFGFLKNILRKLVDSLPKDQPPTATDTEVLARPEAAAAPIAKAGSRPSNGHHRNGNGLELPLALILKGLPLELQPRVKWASVGETMVSIPMEKV